MASWRARAQAVREQGAVERRDWNPEPNSIHWHIYRAWMRNGGKAPARENFCHYWRIVLFWGPLRWVTQPLRSRKFWLSIFTLLVTAVVMTLMVTAIKHPGDFFGVVGGLLVIAWVAAGITYTIHALSFLLPAEYAPPGIDWLKNKSYGVHALLTLVFLPVMIVVMVLIAVVFAVGGVLIAPFQKYRIHKRVLNMHPAKAPWANPVTFAIAALVAAIVYFATTGNEFAKDVLGFAGGLGVFFGIILFSSWVSDILKRNKAVRIEEERAKTAAADEELIRMACKFLVKARFELQHPEYAGNESKFAAWEARYARYFASVSRVDMYSSEHAAYVHISNITNAFYVKYPDIYGIQYSARDRMRVFGKQPEPVATSPSKFEKLVELGSFVWTVLLVRKWRICPIVEMPTQTT